MIRRAVQCARRVRCQSRSTTEPAVAATEEPEGSYLAQHMDSAYQIWGGSMLNEPKEYPVEESLSHIKVKSRFMHRLLETAETKDEEERLKEGIEKMKKKAKRFKGGTVNGMQPDESNLEGDRITMNTLLRFCLRYGKISQMTYDWMLGDLIDVYGTKMLDAPFLTQLLIRSKLVEQDANLTLAAIEKSLVPPEWLDEVAYTDIPDECASFREEITDRCYAIDDSSTFEVDDAISINGDWVTVHVADVTRYLPYQSEVRVSAEALATTVYFPEAVLTMLPRAIIDAATLKASPEESLVLSIAFKFDSNQNIVDKKVVVGHTTNCVRITYEQVNSIMKEAKRAPYERFEDVSPPEWYNDSDRENLTRLNDIAMKLREKRTTAGALMIMRPEWYPKLTARELGEEDDVKSAKKYDIEVNLRKNEGFDSRKIVEEFMLMAGHSVAELCQEEDIPCPYRVTPPNEIEELNYTPAALPVKPQSLEESVPAAYEQGTRKLKYQKAAFYSSHCIGHVAVKKAYSHFTSPLRRYPDLLVHYHMKDWLLRKNKLIAETDDQETITAILKKTLPSACQKVSNVSNSKKKTMENVTQMWLMQAMRRQWSQNGKKLQTPLYIGETHWVAASHEHNELRGNNTHCSTVVFRDYGFIEKYYHNGELREGMSMAAVVEAVEPHTRALQFRVVKA